MNQGRWKPERGETYYIITVYAPDPYEYVWDASKDDLHRYKNKTLYRTIGEARAAKRELV